MAVANDVKANVGGHKASLRHRHLLLDLFAAPLIMPLFQRSDNHIITM